MMRKGKRIESETQYLVKWDGYGVHECSWCVLPPFFRIVSIPFLLYHFWVVRLRNSNREYRANLKPHDTKLVKDFEAALSREGLASRNTVILLDEATSHWDPKTGNPLVVL